MYGRSSCLLAISILILAPALLPGQSGREEPAPEFAIPLPPRVVRPPIGEPFPFLPRLPVTPPFTIDLPTIARAAGTIFSGTVTAIARRPATHGLAVETVAITFHIENAIRGATPGEDLTISQWIGLWSGGQRYRVGERVLLFLYPPSKLGLTSCVAGAMGRLTIDSWGRVLLSAQHLSAFRADPVLGGKSRLRFSDFALAVRRASEEE
ncbi:MAG: hypothetical protein ABR881_20210 [Candidatus Sulfotelmatobacter sp.]|jgi:hypothetical protein